LTVTESGRSRRESEEVEEVEVQEEGGGVREV
jgi:hypothetical protein